LHTSVLAISQTTMVARIIDARPGDELEVGVAVARPASRRVVRAEGVCRVSSRSISDSDSR
jgi:hypothetical protein